MKRIFQLLIFIVLSLSAGWSAPRLPNLVADHMVFQQGKKIHVWGWADPKEKVSVRMAGGHATSVADAKGHWSVELPAMSPGGPYTLTISGSKDIVVKDVLIGEVWVASGQSNMTYALNGAMRGADEVAHADYPEIRLFTVPRKVAVQPQQDTLSASWQICSPESAKDFSAVAYFFARELHRRLGVPIGVIQSAWPGTRIEEWMNPEAFNGDPQVHSEIDEWNKQSSGVREYAQTPLAFDLEFKGFELINDSTKTLVPVRFVKYYENDQGGPSLYWSYDWASAPESTFEFQHSGADRDGSTVEVRGLLDHAARSILTGRWTSDGTTANLSLYTGLRYWVRGNGKYRLRFLEPSTTDWDDYATALQAAGTDWRQITVRFQDLHQEGWGVVEEFTPQSQTGIAVESTTQLGFPGRPPSGLFEGMITPLLPLPVRGVIWYQGEGNTLRASLYRRQLSAMIEGWRTGWRDPDAAFLIVELPNHGSTPDQPSESAWAQLREAQLQTARTVPNAGLAVTIDLGDAKNVHPVRKLEVGQRLAYWALGTTYRKPIAFSGPLFESARNEGNRIAINFTNVDGDLTTSDGGPVTGFAIAGADRIFHWANAVIEGNAVVVSSPDVPEPVAVRYAWADSPRCNLINRAGLPASPFRSDQWAGR